jgi:hypothetical protein
MAVLTAIYLLAANGLQWWKSDLGSVERFAYSRIFDGITFAGSLMLLLGLAEPQVISALGSTKPFLFFAAFAGLVYALHALRPR